MGREKGLECSIDLDTVNCVYSYVSPNFLDSALIIAGVAIVSHISMATQVGDITQFSVDVICTSSGLKTEPSDIIYT